MEKQQIHLNDIRRILFGEVPPEFLLEVLFRSIIMYTVLILVVRLLGKRTNAQLTISEKAVFITLGAIVSLPMQGPTTGMLIGVIVLFCMLFFQRTLTLSFFSNERWEKLLQGKTRLLVKDSVIDMEELNRINLSRGQLFEALRNKDIRQLGQVKRVYLEACGDFSIFHRQPQPGLSILPNDDMPERKDELLVCSECGNSKQHNNARVCTNCNNDKWINASKESL